MSVPVVRFVYGGSDQEFAAAERPYTLVWDGRCTTCARLIGVLHAWDREGLLETVPSQNTGVHARFPWIPAAAYEEAVQLIGPGGRTWQGAAAVEQLLRILPHGGWLAWVFDLPLAGALADRLYRWFARNRYRFGCGEHCQVTPRRLSFESSPPGAEAEPPPRL